MVTISFSDHTSPKREKGNSIIAFPSDYIVLDLETTGLSPEYDEIIEIAALRVRNNKIVDTFQSFVKPFSEIPDYITELTGITNEMVSSAPSPSEIIPSAINFIGSDIIVGANVGFDINFMCEYASYLDLSPFTNNYINIQRIYRKCFRTESSHRLLDMADRLNVSKTQNHRALSDCEITYKCFLALCDYVISHYPDFDSFVSLFSKSGYSKQYKHRLENISTENTEFDETHPFYGKVCCPTGKLEKMDRETAAQHIVNLGGIFSNDFNQKTNFLILSDDAYKKSLSSAPTGKHKKAIAAKIKGQDIEIISESTFYDLIFDN